MNKSKIIIYFQLLCVLHFQNYHFTLKGLDESSGHFDSDPELSQDYTCPQELQS